MVIIIYIYFTYDYTSIILKGIIRINRYEYAFVPWHNERNDS